VIRTFPDANILIAACRKDREHSENAQRLLEDPCRVFLASVFLRLEVFPQASYHQYPLQRAYLNEFFMSPGLEWATDLNAVVQLALSESEQHGLGALDSLHIAAAMLLGADQFITAEKPTKPMFRVRNLNVIYIKDAVHV
jgi:predicted nucleic acid-binding protein